MQHVNESIRQFSRECDNQPQMPEVPISRMEDLMRFNDIRNTRCVNLA